MKPKIINRKAKPAAPRGLNVRGLPRPVLAYLEKRAKDLSLSTEAFVRMKIIESVKEKTAPKEVGGWATGAHFQSNVAIPIAPGTAFTNQPNT